MLTHPLETRPMTIRDHHIVHKPRADGRRVETDGDAVKREVCDDIAVAVAKARAAAADAKAALAEMERDIDRAADRARFDLNRDS